MGGLPVDLISISLAHENVNFSVGFNFMYGENTNLNHLLQEYTERAEGVKS